MDPRTAASSAVLAAVCLTLAAGIAADPADNPAFKAEKSYGIAKAGKNDCQTSTHACAGQTSKDGQGDGWVYVPKRSCDRNIGGSTQGT